MLSTQEILRRLRTLREKKVLKQDQLAGRLGIDRTTYARKEKGYIPITTDEWVRISAAMDTDIAYFFNSSGDGAKASPDEEKAIVLVKTLNSLSFEERSAIIAGLRHILKVAGKKKVRDALEKFMQY